MRGHKRMFSIALVSSVSFAVPPDPPLKSVSEILSSVPVGELRICRSVGVIGAMDSKTAVIPAGTGFLPVGPEITYAASFSVKTLRDVKIGPKPACAVAAASVESNFTGKAISPAKRRLGSTLSLPGLDLDGFVIKGFVVGPWPRRPQYIERHYTDDPRARLFSSPDHEQTDLPQEATVVCSDLTYGYPQDGTAACASHGGLRVRVKFP